MLLIYNILWATFTELALNGVPAFQGGVQTDDGIRHGAKDPVRVERNARRFGSVARGEGGGSNRGGPMGPAYHGADALQTLLQDLDLKLSSSDSHSEHFI